MGSELQRSERGRKCYLPLLNLYDRAAVPWPAPAAHVRVMEKVHAVGAFAQCSFSHNKMVKKTIRVEGHKNAVRHVLTQW